MPFTVVFTPEAEDQIAAIYRYIARAASPITAERYASALIDYCEGLRNFPRRATLHDVIRPGLRLTNYKGRAVIAFAVEDRVVSIIGVYYGGQDYGSVLQSE